MPGAGQISKFPVVIKKICIFPKNFPISEEKIPFVSQNFLQPFFSHLYKFYNSSHSFSGSSLNFSNSSPKISDDLPLVV